MIFGQSEWDMNENRVKKGAGKDGCCELNKLSKGGIFHNLKAKRDQILISTINFIHF